MLKGERQKESEVFRVRFEKSRARKSRLVKSRHYWSDRMPDRHLIFSRIIWREKRVSDFIAFPLSKEYARSGCDYHFAGVTYFCAKKWYNWAFTIH